MSERNYKDEARQSEEYVRDLKRRDGYERPIGDCEYNEELEAFEKTVLEYEGLWNTCNFGYTLEFSTSNRFFEEKSEILHCSSHRLKKGTWDTGRCGTCKGYDEDTPIHVDIQHSADWGDQHEEYLHDYNRMKALRDKFPRGTANFSIATLNAVLEALPERSDLAIELSMAVDKALEVQSHITYYK